jgi:hypothetical protein
MGLSQYIWNAMEATATTLQGIPYVVIVILQWTSVDNKTEPRPHHSATCLTIIADTAPIHVWTGLSSREPPSFHQEQMNKTKKRRIVRASFSAIHQSFRCDNNWGNGHMYV